MIRDISTSDIVIGLLAEPNISALLPGGMFEGDNILDNPPFQRFATVNTVTTNIINRFHRSATLEFAIIGERTDTPKTLRGIVEEITNTMIGDICMDKVDYNGFNVFKIQEGSMNGPGYTPKKNPVFTKQYIFTFERYT